VCSSDLGQADFIVRISRSHSIWFDTQLGTPTYYDPSVEPTAAQQPAGTSLVIAYRGATNVTPTPAQGNHGAWVNGNAFNWYGDTKTVAEGGVSADQFTPVYFGGNNTWKTSMPSINGARYFQFRVSFISNASTGLYPELSAIAFPFSN
jgi:hypothetical protein